MSKNIYKVLLSLPRPIVKCITDISDFLKNPKLCIQNRKQIRELFVKYSDIYQANGDIMSRADIKSWKKGLLYYAISSPRAARKIADNFCRCKLNCLKLEEKLKEKDATPVFLCVVKNDLERIKLSYEHHRKLGVKHFVYIDNGSTDGTLEWLLEQDVTVYQILDPFIMWAKVAWISKVINQIGFDRWYLILDSDELMVYPGCEDYKIDAFVQYMEKKNYTRVLSFMLDMYAKGPLFEGASKAEDIYEKLCYFDTDSYTKKECLHYQKIMGGPRERLFGSKNSMEMLQNKYPLVYVRRGEIYRFHYVSPYYDNFKTGCLSALLHYKFIDGDFEKYTEIAKAGNYANGSRLYKDIVRIVGEQAGELSFYGEGSIQYRSSMDLLKLPFMCSWRDEEKNE